MAKRSKPQVWERTLWAIQRKDGAFAGPSDGPPYVFTTRFTARQWCHSRTGEQPVKVRERIEVLG